MLVQLMLSLFFLFPTHQAEAKKKDFVKKSLASSRISKRSIGNSHLQTDVNFSGHDVSGRYQVPAEAVATVEKEKPLLDLIEPRRDFGDRLRKSVSQR